MIATKGELLSAISTRELDSARGRYADAQRIAELEAKNSRLESQVKELSGYRSPGERDRLFTIIDKYDEQLTEVLTASNLNYKIDVLTHRRRQQGIRDAVPDKRIIETTRVDRPIQIGIDIDAVNKSE